MESDGKLKEIDIKNRTCCFFDDVTNLKISNISADEKSYEMF